MLEIEGILVWSGLKVTYRMAGEKRRAVVDVKIRYRKSRRARVNGATKLERKLNPISVARERHS